MLAFVAVPFLGACSNSIEFTIHNTTTSTLIATLRVDRLGPKGITLAQETLSPNARATFGPVEAPALEYIELVINRPSDLGDVPVSRRIPRGFSEWTITADSESWAGFTIIEGIDDSSLLQN